MSIPSLLDLDDVEVLHMGFKNGSWWEEFATQTDKVKEYVEEYENKALIFWLTGRFSSAATFYSKTISIEAAQPA